MAKVEEAIRLEVAGFVPFFQVPGLNHVQINPMPELFPPTPLHPTLDAERRQWLQGYQYVAGVDEAGRGCLAGPVVAAAIILPQDLLLPGVQDSKTLSPTGRAQIREAIERHALAIGIGHCSPAEIDDLNILWAAMEAMRRAVENLTPPADFVLIDGNRAFPGCMVPHRTLIKGDRRSHSIAAASILAKETRDALMVQLDAEYPMYGWAQHKGYPTAAHYAALKTHGPSPHHRCSFRLS